ncbi:MAG: Lipid-A-disaccharide synthase [Pedosphaera sp.]|nr:Lipid-A-disaccharide synthase [Pedosphaera sp.]
MVIAGETSGDMLAAELVKTLRAELMAEYRYSDDLQPLHADLAPRFFGAGGQRMAAAGVELEFDMTSHAVTGLWEVLRKYRKFKQLFDRLYQLALEREPHAIICVDFSGFNRRFASAIKKHVRSQRGTFNNWNPKIIQYVSPQVWASRPGRAYTMPAAYDLLLSIFPFEKDWYASRVPKLHVEFVGHPIIDRYATFLPQPATETSHASSPLVLLLPGSRPGEVKRHLPVLCDSLRKLRAAIPGICARMVLPEESLVQQAKAMGLPADLEVRLSSLAESLSRADLAIASTGTVTMECAYFGVPTVALYKTSWPTYQIGKRLITVKYMAMPNLLANEEIFPEFLQDTATAENISRAALELLRDETRRNTIKAKLKEIITSLGNTGASQRATEAIIRTL